MASFPPDKDDLGARISAAQAKQAERHKPRSASNSTSGYGIGMKIVLDLIGGIVVGLVFGLALDHVLGTQPWGLLVLLALGSAAGFRLMLRTAEQQAKRMQNEMQAGSTDVDQAS